MKKNTPAYRRLRDEAFEWYLHSDAYKRDQEKMREEVYRDLFDGHAAHLARASPQLSETERRIRAERWAKDEMPRSLSEICIDYNEDDLIRRYLEACPKPQRDG